MVVISILLGFLLAILATFYVTAWLLSLITSSSIQDRFDVVTSKFNALKKEIDQTHNELCKTEERAPKQQLHLLHDHAIKTLSKAKKDTKQYLSSNAIRDSCDTYSEFNLCGIAQNYFHCNIDDVEREFADLISAKHPGDIYNKIEKHMQDALDLWNKIRKVQISILFEKKPPVNDLLQEALSQMECLRSVLSRYKELQLFVQSFTPKKIALNDIKYFKMEGSVQYFSDVTGGGVNMQGAVLGGLLAGDAGAIVGSKMNTGIRTSRTSIDSRKIILVFRDGEQWITHNVKSREPNRTLEAFRKLMTEKEENMVKLEAERANSTPNLPSSAGELKAFKELLDSGIITQEEYDAKKKQLLGL